MSSSTSGGSSSDFQINWSERNYTLREFKEKYGSSLPTVVMVTRGCYGHAEMESFAAGQKMRIYSIFAQKRVIARDSSGRFLGFPVTCPIKFKVKNEGRKDAEFDIENIIKQYTLPLKTRINSNNIESAHLCIGDQSYKVADLGEIELILTYDEMYLVGNFLNGDTIGEKQILIPLYASIIVVVGTGFKPGEKKRWTSYLAELSQKVGPVDESTLDGYQGISVYSAIKFRGRNVYEYKEPETYAKFVFGNETENDYSETYEYGSYENANPNDSKLLATRPPPPPPPPLSEPPSLEIKSILKAASPLYDTQIPDVKSILRGKTKADKKSVARPDDVIAKEASATWSKTIKSMSIGDVGQHLAKIGLSNFVADFKRESIDGMLLESMNKKVLRDEFQMSEIQAMKLINFIQTGHIAP